MEYQCYRLNSIERKLQTGSSVLNTNDLKFMKNIIKSFHRVWKCWKIYPEVTARVDDERFQCIFDDMFPYFRSNGPELNLVCEYCDMEFPLLNNDLAFAYEMHQQTPEHVKSVDTLTEFHSLSASVSGATLAKDRQNHLAEYSVTDRDSKVRSKDKARADSMHSSKSDCHGDDCIQTSRARNSNCRALCEVGGKMRQKTIQKYESEKKISPAPLLPISSGSNKFCGCISSIAEIYRSKTQYRLAYFLNKISVFKEFYKVGQCFECALCNFNSNNIADVETHLSGTNHRAMVAEKVISMDPKSASLEPCIFTAVKNTKHPQCLLCRVILPKANPHNYSAHLASNSHARKVKAFFQLPLFKDWERGIILRDGSPYCVLCKLVLPSEISMQTHVSEPAHLNFAIQS